MEIEICSACGATLRDTLAPDEPGPRTDRDPKLTAFLSLAFPGIGHAYLGMWGQAIARIAITAWMVAAAAAGWSIDAAGAKVLASLFALVALGTWAVSAHDAYREAEGLPKLVMLKGRMFLYLVVSLLALLLVQLFLGASASNTAI